jgi:hypothetical protein
MNRYFTSLLFLLLLSTILPAQTRTDSIAGNYTRQTWYGVGNMHMDYGNGMSAEISGYTISTTDETLLLDKNHCAALTVYTQPANYNYVGLVYGNPVVYYGIWRMSGDTIVITYTKHSSEITFVSYGATEPPSPIVKMDQPMQRKYLMKEYRVLATLEPGDFENTLFYKEEELAQ